MRDDIELLEYAKAKGWTPIYHKDDLLYKRFEIPHFAISFEKENVMVWNCGRSYPTVKMWWQARGKNKGILEPYETRREYSSLKEALDKE